MAEETKKKDVLLIVEDSIDSQRLFQHHAKKEFSQDRFPELEIVIADNFMDAVATLTHPENNIKGVLIDNGFPLVAGGARIGKSRDPQSDPEEHRNREREGAAGTMLVRYIRGGDAQLQSQQSKAELDDLAQKVAAMGGKLPENHGEIPIVWNTATMEKGKLAGVVAAAAGKLADPNDATFLDATKIEEKNYHEKIDAHGYATNKDAPKEVIALLAQLAEGKIDPTPEVAPKDVNSGKSRDRGSSPDAGFTLIGMSMALLIIGFLTALVFSGIAIVEAAKLRQVIDMKQKLLSAVTLFNTRYMAYPGDFANFDGLLPGINAGDGNGYIYYTSGNSDEWGEVANVYAHLSEADLLDKDYEVASLGHGAGPFYGWDIGNDAPAGPLNKQSTYWLGSHDVDMYGEVAFSRNVIFYTNRDWTLGGMKLEHAIKLDKKFDDAKAATGTIRAYRTWGTYKPSVNDCVDDERTAATANYLLLSSITETNGKDCIVELGTF